MSTAKVTISLEQQLLEKLDQFVTEEIFGNRSQAIQIALKEKIDRLEGNRLAQECAKLDIDFEQAMAEEGMSKELSEWPGY